MWNTRPSDGANIGAALLGIFGLAVLATGGLGLLVCLITVVVLRVQRR